MIVRRRVRIARGRVTSVGIVVAGLLALGVAWYAGAGVALGLGADPATVDGLTGYRAVVDWLAAPHVPSPTTRAIVAGAGVLAFLVLGRLALAQLPKPRVPRGALVLEHDVRGTTTVEPRAIERAVESALRDFDSVSARWEDGHVTAAVTSSRPRQLADALAKAPAEASAALRRHGLPEAEVRVVLRHVRSSTNREVL